MRKIRMLIPSSVGMSKKTRPKAYFATNHYSAVGYRLSAIGYRLLPSHDSRLTTHDLSGRLTDLPTHRLRPIADSPSLLRHASRSQPRIEVRVRDVHPFNPLIDHLELEGLDGVEVRHVLGDDLLDSLVRFQALRLV